MSLRSFIRNLFSHKHMESPIVINHADKVEVSITINQSVDTKAILDKLDMILANEDDRQIVRDSVTKLDRSENKLKQAVAAASAAGDTEA